MIIENHLLAITNAMFKDKGNWKWVSDEQKNEFFFIINRLLSKRFPDKAQLLNLKTIDKVSSLDLWHHFMKSKPYPNWIWSKSEKEKQLIPDNDYKLLLLRLKIKDIDLDYLIENHFDFIKEELNYYKKLEKQ
jgi:hypothetical protein